MSVVLVVDDEPHLVRTLAINLRARDYAVETAGDGRSALQAFHEIGRASCRERVL